MNSPTPSRLNRVLPALRLMALVALPALARAQTRYVITNLGSAGGVSIQATAINASGQVVGTDSTTFQSTRAFRYSNGTISALASPGLGRDQGLGINAAGTVVGTSSNTTTGASRGFIVSSTGVMTDLGDNTSAVGIADDGTILGGAFPRMSLRSPAGVVTIFGPTTGSSTATAISANGIVAGYTDNGPRRAFRYSNGVMTDLGALPGGNNSYGYAVNNAGVVVGSSNDSTNGKLQAVIFSGGTVTSIDPTGTSSQAQGINAAGVVVGINSANHAFIYTQAGGLVDLNTVVTNLATSGFSVLTSATAINDAGQIVGYGSVGAGRFGAFRLEVDSTPVIATQPTSHTVAAGSSAVFSVSATGTALTYQWLFNGSAIAGATSANYTISSASADNVGSYSVRVTNSSGSSSVTSQTATLTVDANASSRLINLSILTGVSGGSDSFTLGYAVAGSGTKPVVIRAAGPSLAKFSVPSPLDDPKFDTYADSTRTGGNNDWGGGSALTNAMFAVGAFEFNGPTSRDAALAVDVPVGRNSVVVSSASGNGGNVIAEVYDATPSITLTPSTPRLVNVSVLKPIGDGFTVGFNIGGNASKTVLIRAVGPGLATVNVTGFAADPQLALFSSNQAKIGENNDWGGTAALSSAFLQVGAFPIPTNSKDAALVTTLAPGGYSVQVTSASGGNGLVIVEIYAVP